MEFLRPACTVRAHLSLVATAGVVAALASTSQAGVRGQFDFPREIVAVPVSAAPDLPTETGPRAELVEITVPVSFRIRKGNPEEVVQIEVELELTDENAQVVAYEPQTTLAGHVVGEIEEKVTTEEVRDIGGAVGASLPIPGLEAAQIGPSVNLADSERVVRTETIRRRPQLQAVVVAGSTARRRGAFFQLRPAPDVTLEGSHTFTLHAVVPQGQKPCLLKVKCRALAEQDWLLFERKAEVAGASGQVTVLLPGLNTKVAEHRELTSRHTDEPCPWCDAGP